MKISQLLLLLVISISISSCYKEPLTKGIITVYDNQGNTVSNATVTLSQKDIVGVNQTYVVSTLLSDYKGQTEHVLELEALMNVTAYTLSSTNDTLLFGQSVIRLTRGKTIYKDVEVFPAN